MSELEYMTIPIDLIDPHPENPRLHPDEQLAGLQESYEELGQFRSFTVWKRANGRFTQVTSHGITQAMRDKGATHARVEAYPEDTDPLFIKRVMLADNLHAQKSNDDQEVLARLLQEQQDVDIRLTMLGSSNESLQQMLEELGNVYLDSEDEEDGASDELPEEVEARAKLGDVWALGRHRLLAGDCTDKRNVQRLMNGVTPDLIVTDPPYGMNLDVSSSDLGRGDPNRVSQRARHYTPVVGDNQNFDPTFIFRFFGGVSEIFLWGADYYAEHIPHKNDGSWLVWDKRAGIEDMEFSSSSFELCWSKQKHRRAIIRERWAGVLGMEEQDMKARAHPAQKPLGVMSWIIDRYSQSNNVVLDLFLGSGTTLISCERTGRNCFGFEIDPHYADVCLSRWEAETGQQATLLQSAEAGVHAP